MKKNKIILGICIICTIVISSLCMNHITQIAATRAVKVLDGVEIVLDAGHGGITIYPHILRNPYKIK